jgi:hypothetical protein
MNLSAKIGWFIVLALALYFCSSGGSSSGGGGSPSADYQFLYDHKASVLDGHTVRWGTNTVKVFTNNIPGAEAAINRWAGPVNFFFVGSPLSDGISLQLRVKGLTSQQQWLEIHDAEKLNAYGNRLLDRLIGR